MEWLFTDMGQTAEWGSITEFQDLFWHFEFEVSIKYQCGKAMNLDKSQLY